MKSLLLLSLLSVCVIYADNGIEENISIKSLFDTPKINNIKPQKLALATPVKIAEKPKSIVPVKKATEPESTIQAIGYGNSEDEALKGAYQNAVEQYVGVLVDSSTIIRNDQLIKNDILTFSNGYIESYKKLSSKGQMGLWEVKIDAVIKKQNVLEKIKSLNIDPIDIKDSEQTYAKLVTQVQSKFDAQDLIIKLVRETAEYEFTKKRFSLKVDSVDIDLDMATRKTVPVTINYSLLFNWDEYTKITNKFEKLFENIGAKIISSREIKSEDRTDDIYFQNPLCVGVIVKRNNKRYLNIWQFPKSFANVYPFSGYDSQPRWKVHTEEGQHFLIYGSNGSEHIFPYSLYVLGSNKQIIWSNNKKGEFVNNRKSFRDPYLFNIINGNLFICPIYHEYPDSDIAISSVITEFSEKINMDIESLKDLKQIKISMDERDGGYEWAASYNPESPDDNDEGYIYYQIQVKNQK